MLYDYIRGVKSGETSVSYMVEDIMRKTMEGRIVELKTDDEVKTLKIYNRNEN